MKKLNTESKARGIATALVCDYQSGQPLGDAKADWDQYRIWAEGPSDVCQACRILREEDIKRLGIQSDTIVFLLD